MKNLLTVTCRSAAEVLRAFPRHLSRLAAIAILFSLIPIQVGCPPPQTPANGAYVAVDRTIGGSDEDEEQALPQSENATANRRFQQAVALWDQGEYPAAEEALRMFLVDFPDDDLAPSAEAYLGRTLMATSRFRDAQTVFESLASRPDDSLKSLGVAYLAFVDESQSGREQAFERFARRAQDIARFSLPLALAVRGDEVPLGVIGYRGLKHANRPVEAIDALSAVRRASESDELDAWALGAANELARGAMNGQQLVDCLTLEKTEFSVVPDLAIGVCASVLVEKYLSADDRESAAIAMERGGLAMMRAGLEDLFAQSNRLLSDASGDQALRYGVVLSLTGPDQQAGRAALGGVLLAARAFEQSEGVSELVIEDTGGTSTGATEAASRAADRGAKLLIGPVEPELSAEVAAVAAERAIPFFSLAASYDDLGDAAESGQNLWQIGFNPAAEARAIAARIRQEGPASGVALILGRRDLPYLNAFERALRSELSTDGAFEISTFDMAGDANAQAASQRVAREVSQSDAKNIVFATTAAEASVLTAWLADTGIWSGQGGVIFFGNSFVWGDELLRNSERYVQGMYLPIWFDDAISSEEASRFAAAFERTYGRKPDALEAFAYDAASVARALMVEEGLRSSANLSERLSQATVFLGATGELQFGDPGRSIVVPQLMRIRGTSLRQAGAE